MFTIRPATPADTPLIFDLICKLSEYEKMRSDVVTSVEELRQNIFEKKFADVILAEENGKAVGFALYFFNFSTFVGKPGLYLEDLFVEPAHRGKGYGKKLFVHLSKIAERENCGRMEWAVLDWNQPAIDFYRALGAKAMDEWTVYRLDRHALKKLADSGK